MKAMLEPRMAAARTQLPVFEGDSGRCLAIMVASSQGDFMTRLSIPGWWWAGEDVNVLALTPAAFAWGSTVA
jgi:hypothetical protein